MPMASTSAESTAKRNDDTVSLLQFIRKASIHNVFQFAAEYTQNSETQYRTHALVRSVIGISSFWAAPLFGVRSLAASLLFYFLLWPFTLNARWTVLLMHSGSTLLSTHRAFIATKKYQILYHFFSV